MTATPLVDAVLVDPLAMPPGVAEALRRREARARQLGEELSRAQAALGPEVDVVRNAQQEIARFLGEDGALRRLLRRPPRQIALDQPALRSFERYSTGLLARAQDALTAAEQMTGAAAQLAQVTAEFRDRFPDTLRRLSRENRATEADLRACRRGEDARAFLLRLRRVAARLELLRNGLSQELLDSPPHLVQGAPEPLTVDELLALFKARVLQRSALSRDPGLPRRRMRALTARHLKAMGDAAGWVPGGEGLSDLVAQTMAERTLAGGGLEGGQPDETALWLGLLEAAERALTGVPGGWFAQVATGDVQGEMEWTEGDHFVVPIGGGYVAITPTVRSPVLVREAHAGLVTCSVYHGDAPVDYRLAELDLAPLFDGLDRSEPGWFLTDRTAEVEVLVGTGDPRFGRIVRRGAIRRTPTPAAQPTDPAPGAVRVLQSPGCLRQSTVLAVESVNRRVTRGWGMETLTVTSPFPGRPELWLRRPGQATTAEHVERESRCFAALQRVSFGCSLEPLGRGRLKQGPEGILYAPPLALQVHQSPVVAEWLDRETLALVREGERLRETAAAAGIALGVFHTAVFAYSVRSAAGGLRSEPRLVLIYAPWATTLGEAFPQDRAVPEYPRLRFRGFVPQVASGTASPESDRAALALWALELLAVRELPGAPGWLSWEPMLWTVTENVSSAFRDPALALRLADQLRA